MNVASVICQNIENNSISIGIATFDSMVRESEYCDSLKLAYNKSIKNNLDLANQVIENADKFEKERFEKNELKKELEEKRYNVKPYKPKKFHFGFTIGASPYIKEDKFKIGPNIMIGFHYSVFSF